MIFIAGNGKSVSGVRRSLTLATITLRLMTLKLCCAVVGFDLKKHKTNKQLTLSRRSYAFAVVAELDNGNI